MPTLRVYGQLPLQIWPRGWTSSPVFVLSRHEPCYETVKPDLPHVDVTAASIERVLAPMLFPVRRALHAHMTARKTLLF